MLRSLASASFFLALAGATTAGSVSRLADVPEAPTIMQVFKSASCGCCKAWVEHMRSAGFEVRVTDLEGDALQAEKRKRGIGENLASCHTAVVNGYVVEGHVPAADIKRLLAEKPVVAGLAAPGMPSGSPGMEVPGGKKDAYDVLSFTRAGKTAVFARH